MSERRPSVPAALAAAIAPDRGLAAERVLPVAEPLHAVLPAAGLVRGQVVASRGIAAVSLALGLAVEATAAGSWLAVVDVPALGLEAVEEFGIPLERVVRIDTGRTGTDRGASWAEVMGAVVDGFEVIITRVPGVVGAAWGRKVQARVQAREAVVITLGPAAGAAGGLNAAVELRATHPRWEGVEAGAGCLRGRRVTVVAEGRRMGRPRQVELWLPGPDGKLTAIAPGVADAAPTLHAVAG